MAPDGTTCTNKSIRWRHSFWCCRNLRGKFSDHRHAKVVSSFGPNDRLVTTEGLVGRPSDVVEEASRSNRCRCQTASPEHFVAHVCSSGGRCLPSYAVCCTRVRPAADFGVEKSLQCVEATTSMTGALFEWPSAHAHDDSSTRWPLRSSDAGVRASTQTLCAPACANIARVVCAHHKQHQSQNPTSQVDEMFLDPADAAHVQMTEKTISRRAPLTLKPRAPGLPFEKVAAHVAGHRVALIMLQPVPPTEPWGQKRVSPNPAATRSASSPSQQVVLACRPETVSVS